MSPTAPIVLADGPLVVQNLTLTDTAGISSYPINFTSPLVLHAQSVNTGTTTYNTLGQDVLISDYFSFFGGCKFHEVVPELYANLR